MLLLCVRVQGRPLEVEQPRSLEETGSLLWPSITQGEGLVRLIPPTSECQLLLLLCRSRLGEHTLAVSVLIVQD